MKYWLTTSMLLALNFYTYSQEETKFKYHSYSEFVNLIQQEQDTLFEYSDAIIQYNPETDQRFTIFYHSKDAIWTEQEVDTLVIEKHVSLRNIHFVSTEEGPNRENGNQATSLKGVWYKCRFEGQLDIQGCANFRLFNSKLNNHFRIISRDFSLGKTLEKVLTETELEFQSNRIVKDFSVISDWAENINTSRINIGNNTFDIQQYLGTYAIAVNVSKPFQLFFTRNTIRSKGPVRITAEDANWVVIEDNLFTKYTFIGLKEFYGLQRLMFNRNVFNDFLLVDFPLEIPPSAFIGWKQFEGQLISNNGFGPYVSDLFVTNRAYLEANRFKSDFFRHYYDSVRIADSDAYVGEMSLRGRLYNHHKAKYDYETANQVFLDLKDLETERLGYLYRQNPSFKTYFKWKINQFLKLFVDYGTEPAKAIVFAVYVIAFFALIYLFFPNSWDSHGKNRLKDRYLFFLKYLSLNKGIRDVYLEEKKEEIAEGEKFKAILEKHKDDAPAIFYHTAIPLYKWSMAGTRTYSRLIQNFDFLKGKWKETDPKIRPLRTVLVVLMFAIALTYDLFIKILNAVMLSINTFTTLGFGEIPIKGLPRYLAIIQGFIGWFMLTIFSVSLISQLLN